MNKRDIIMKYGGLTYLILGTANLCAKTFFDYDLQGLHEKGVSVIDVMNLTMGSYLYHAAEISDLKRRLKNN